MPDAPAPPTPKPTAPAAPYADPRPRQDPPSAPGEITQVLLDVLRNINREVKTVLALDGKAQAAVIHFQAISASLRTLADGPVHSLSGVSRATPSRT